MFKWHDRAYPREEQLGHGRFDAGAMFGDRAGGDGFQTRKVFEGPTERLERLQCHVSTLTPGAGYPPHIDPYDVAIVFLKGEVETLGQRVREGSLILYPAGEPHGMRNAGDTTAEYVVFEFQGRPSLLRKAADPRRWLRKMRFWG
jgi:quercetin dioxygenase-like cupin family protein